MCWRTKLQEQVTLAVEYGFSEVYVALPISDATQLLEDQNASRTVLPTQLVDSSNNYRDDGRDVVLPVGERFSRA
jgi:hypothetical protein